MKALETNSALSIPSLPINSAIEAQTSNEFFYWDHNNLKQILLVFFNGNNQLQLYFKKLYAVGVIVEVLFFVVQVVLVFTVIILVVVIVVVVVVVVVVSVVVVGVVVLIQFLWSTSSVSISCRRSFDEIVKSRFGEKYFGG